MLCMLCLRGKRGYDGGHCQHQRERPVASDHYDSSPVIVIWFMGRAKVARFSVQTAAPPPRRARPRLRSEEHTSELQSLMRLSYAVFCLKKKKIPFIIYTLIYNRLAIEYIELHKKSKNNF